jgi:hypothetical protein
MEQDQKYCVVKFVKFIKDQLGVKQPFKVKLTDTRDQDLKTYAFYDKTSGDMKVYTRGRGMADVLRSIAHEMVHHLQNQRQQLNVNHPDVGGKIEDEANAVAGQLVKKFGYQFPKLIIYAQQFDVDNTPDDGV